MVEAIGGMLNRLETEEVVEDASLAVRGNAGAFGGKIGRIRMGMSGDARDGRLSAQSGITLEGISSTAMAEGLGVFFPHHIEMKTVLAGVQTVPLMALLRAATEPDAAPVMLAGQGLALLTDPGVRIALETLSFDAGPLQIKGSAKVVPQGSGQLGAEVHIAATGMDLLLAQAKTQPKLQQAMPMMLMAKGMGRPEGQSLVWDISLGDGPMTVNGIPFGQPGGSSR